MKKQKLYIETSVWNFYFADDAPDKKEATIKFFEKIKEDKFEIYISDAVLDEIHKAPSPKKERLLKLIEKFYSVRINFNDAIEKLAKIYLSEDFLSEKHYFDILHVAYATEKEVDFLISWNMIHLAKMSKQKKINRINSKYDYKSDLKILTPMEFLK